MMTYFHGFKASPAKALLRLCVVSAITLVLLSSLRGDLLSHITFFLPLSLYDQTFKHSRSTHLSPGSATAAEQQSPDSSEKSHGVRLEHKDIGGEWFERPLVLTDPSIAHGYEQHWLHHPPHLTLISIDFKLGPVFAMKHALKKHGVRVLENSMSPYCHVTDSCGDLEVPGLKTDFSPSDDTFTKFWRRYKNDRDFLAADGFLCIYPASLCELFLPFKKPLLIVIDDRYELGRTRKAQWESWKRNLHHLLETSEVNIGVATNTYDMEYLKYFTEISLPVVPFACEYVKVRYRPILTHPFLLMPLENPHLEQVFINWFQKETAHLNMTGQLVAATSLYGPGYTVEQLRKHPGLVVVPHQVSYLSLTELLRTDIPLYLPTVEMMSNWHIEGRILKARTLPTIVNSATKKGRKSEKIRHKMVLSGTGGLPDPNDRENQWASGFWLTFADFFSWPGVRHFNSVQDLAVILNGTTEEDLLYASSRAKAFNEQEQVHVDHFWKVAVHKLKALKSAAMS